MAIELELAFETTRARGTRGDVAIDVQTVTTMEVAGPLAWVDPSYIAQAEAQPVKPGPYTVELATAQGRLVAARARSGEIVRWERTHNVLVEYGIACVLPADAIPAIGDGWKAMGQAVAANRGTAGWGWARHVVGDHEAIVFTSGIGDGVYPTWRGFDASDRPAAIAIDFNLLCEAIEEEALIEAALASPPGAICELDHGVLVVRTARGFEIQHPDCRIASARFVDATGRSLGPHHVLPGATTTLVEPTDGVAPDASLLIVLGLGTRPLTILERRAR